MNKFRSILTGGVCAAIFVAAAPALAQDARVDGAINQSVNATVQAERAQQQIDNLDAERGELFADYRATLQRIQARRLYVERLEVYLQSQANQIDDFRLQIEGVDDIVGELEPMLQEMVDALEQFIRLDTPFLLEERLERVARLRETLDLNDVSPGEKYRQIMNAYAIEMDHGRFVKSWEARLEGAEGNPMVDYVLFGRVAWTYLTKDERQAWMWNTDTGAWERLPDAYIEDIRQAMRIAQDQASQDLYRGPVPGPTTIN